MYYACILLVLVNVLALSCGLEGLVVIASTVLPRVLVGINAGGVKKRIKDKRYLVDAVVLFAGEAILATPGDRSSRRSSDRSRFSISFRKQAGQLHASSRHS